MLFLYRLLGYCLLPAAGLHLWFRSLRDPRYRRRWRERLGFVEPSGEQSTIWFHAVSAGETIATAPLALELSQLFPNARLLVTTATPTGSHEVKSRLSTNVDHCYAPYDIGLAVKTFLKRKRPQALFLVETELWPLTLHTLAKRGIPVYLINARLSADSHASYSRFKKTSASMVQSLAGIVCQYQDTAERFRSLGAKPSALHISGSIKFDAELPEAIANTASSLRTSLVGTRSVWIAASTHPTEEEVVLAAHKQLKETLPELALVLVPRHPERATEVSNLCRQQALTYTLLSASPSEVPDVLIGDQMGRLLELYGVADVAFVGGSLNDTGGHNVIEPALHGLPILMGPSRHNFIEICSRFEHAGALVSVTNADTLSCELKALLLDTSNRAEKGRAGQAVVQANRGAYQKLRELCVTWISDIVEQESWNTADSPSPQ